MIGEPFGCLVVKSIAGTGPRGASWWCECGCGATLKLTTSQLKTGGYKSCGCAVNKSNKRKPVPRELRVKYVITVSSWEAMLARCHYATSKQNCYKGVQICDDWYDFEKFLADVGQRPSLQHSLDRENAKGNYCKDNCRWITKFENSSRADRNYTPERNQKVSVGVKLAHEKGLVLTPEARRKIGLGAIKRVGRKLQRCTECNGKSYLPICQKCRNNAAT